MANKIRITNGLGAVKDIVPNRLKEHQALGWKEVKVEVEATEEKKTDAKEVEATEEKKTDAKEVEATEEKKTTKKK